MAFTKLDWTVFVSQTGKEVYDICNLLDVVPKVLVTNNPKRLNEKVAAFLKAEGCKLLIIPFNPLLEHYLQEDILDSNIITLHGYLRILPGQFIASYSPRTIYNGHPGLIAYYEELKGKDPQIKAWEGKYPTVGSVIHKVTEGVDEGEIVRFTAVNNTATSLDEMYDILRETSLDSWKKFFKENIFGLEN